jgi:senataxin
MQVGFLEDWRRMNVAITRARRALLVVGSARTLQAGDARWGALVAHCRQLGCLISSRVLRL